MKPLIFSLILAVIATTIGAGWAISQLHSQIFSQSTENNTNLAAYKELGQSIALTLDKLEAKNEFIALWNNKNNPGISVLNSSDFPIPSDINHRFRNGDPLVLESENEVSLHIFMQHSDTVLTMPLPIDAKQNQTPWTSLLLTLLFYVVVITALLAWLYPLIRRLLIIRKTTKQFGQGNLSSRINSSRFSYTTEIETEFNRMADQIQNLISDNKLLSSAVSHNLKTPITRLRMGVDVLEEANDDYSRKRYIDKINNDLDEMQSLVETLLQYANIDSFDVNVNMERINLNTYVPDLLNKYAHEEVNVSFIMSEKAHYLDTDPRYLSMQLSNLMTNALQYAKSAVNVTIEMVDNNGTEVQIIFDDDGVGIPPDQREQVLQPFWRGNNTSEIKGHGMGLAIVARISDWLGARLYIKQSQTLGGASIGLVFKVPQYA